MPSGQRRPDEGERFRLEPELVALWQAAQGAAEKHRQSVDRGPDRVLDVRSACGVEEPGLDEVIECGPEVPQRSWLIALTAGRVIGCRERGVEQARLGTGEFEICLADGADSKSRAGRRVRTGPHFVHPVGHALRELADRFILYGSKEGVAVGEMPVGGVGDHADHARHLAQHHGVGTTRARQLDAGLD